jgi:hypothetical protein
VSLWEILSLPNKDTTFSQTSKLIPCFTIIFATHQCHRHG